MIDTKESKAGTATTLRLASLVLVSLPSLVLPMCNLPAALLPFEVASTDGGTRTVIDLVTIVVENVSVTDGVDSSSAAGVMNTRAMAGAGTGMSQVHWVWSQLIVLIVSFPWRRPSDSNKPPNVFMGAMSDHLGVV